MPATNVSPNVDNYFSGKGVVKFKAIGAATYRDMGDCSSFSVTPNVQRLEHYSNRAGIRVRDFSRISQRQFSVAIQMDEFTADNMAMVLMGVVTSGVVATDHYAEKIDIMTAAEIRGAVRLIGTNEIGAPCQVDVPDVSFAGSKALELIQEGLATMELTGEANADPTTGSFGQIYWGATQEINP